MKHSVQVVFSCIPSLRFRDVAGVLIIVVFNLLSIVWDGPFVPCGTHKVLSEWIFSNYQSALGHLNSHLMVLIQNGWVSMPSIDVRNNSDFRYLKTNSTILGFGVCASSIVAFYISELENLCGH